MTETTEPTMSWDLRDPSMQMNPWPTLARASAERAVHRDENGIWYVLRHAEVSSLLKDARLGRDLRQWFGYALIRPYLADSPLERCAEQWMFSVDGATHTRLRKLVMRAFAPPAVARMRAHIEAEADALIDEMLANSGAEIDVMKAFAEPFPIRVIARVLGMPLSAVADLKQWAAAVARVIEPTARKRDRVAGNEAAVSLMDHLRTVVGTKRSARGDDVISLLLDAEDGDVLSEEELVSQLVLLFVAGHETTTNLIGNGLLALSRNPTEMARLREQPELGASAVEEMLRYESPVNTVARVPYAPIQVADTLIEPGQLILCMAGAANRDPAVFASPDRFDVGRSPNPHVSFGGGAHYCVGAPLARLEGQVAFQRLLARLPVINVREEGVQWRDTINLRGLAALPAAVRAA